METNIKNKTLKIIVVEPRGSGGMIHYAYQLCTALANEGVDVTLVTARDYEMEGFPHNFSVSKLMNLWSLTESSYGKRSGSLFGKSIQKLFRTGRRAQRGLRFIAEWAKLTRYLIKARPDIIQFGKIEFPFEAIFLSILKQNNLILSQICHEFELREQGNSFVVNITNQLYHWVYDSFSILFFHGKSNQERFSSLFNIDPIRFHIIPHGNEQLFLSTSKTEVSVAEMQNQYNIDPSSPIILFFGNLMPSKGIPDLLTAFAQVQSIEKSARLIIAGKPTKHIDLNSLIKLASTLNITSSVIFDTRYIPIEGVAPLMEMASVVVYPYLNSTQSGSLQVAYAFCRPVIATNVGGLPEAVDDGKSGFLVPPRSPDSIADAIMKFVNNRELTQNMGNYAKHLSETRFSWATVAKKLLAAYTRYLT